VILRRFHVYFLEVSVFLSKDHDACPTVRDFESGILYRYRVGHLPLDHITENDWEVAACSGTQNTSLRQEYPISQGQACRRSRQHLQRTVKRLWGAFKVHDSMYVKFNHEGIYLGISRRIIGSECVTSGSTGLHHVKPVGPIVWDDRNRP
jgi:hypothetical protein